MGNVKKRVDPLTKGGCDEVDYTVAFTPKGGCPLKPAYTNPYVIPADGYIVAFTPKGGCPLKHERNSSVLYTMQKLSSIHPQGWVPIETSVRVHQRNAPLGKVK